MRTNARILIAGIGNIFFGDDAFGVEVAQHLLRQPMPPEVKIVDFGIRGLDLTYALLEPYECVILVDALPRGDTPGTLYVLEPEEAPGTLACPVDPHALDPCKVLASACSLGSTIRRVFVVGCEPQPLASEEDMQMEMSPSVLAAIPEAVRLIEALVVQILSGDSLQSETFFVKE